MTEENNGRWRCPACQVEAVVDGRSLTVYLKSQAWPLHFDCELGKDFDHIDFTKLERVS